MMKVGQLIYWLDPIGTDVDSYLLKIKMSERGFLDLLPHPKGGLLPWMALLRGLPVVDYR